MTETVTNAELRAWALGLGKQALCALTSDPVRFRPTPKPELVDWLLANEREGLAESYRIESTAVARRTHNHTDDVTKPYGQCPGCDLYHDHAKRGF